MTVLNTQSNHTFSRAMLAFMASLALASVGAGMTACDPDGDNLDLRDADDPEDDEEESEAPELLDPEAAEDNDANHPDVDIDLDLTDRPRPTFGFSTCEWDVETSAASQSTHIGVCDAGRDLVSGGCKMTNNAAARLLHAYAMESDSTDLENNDAQAQGDRFRCTYAEATGVIQVTMLCCSP